MPYLSTVEITLRDSAAESEFLAAFGKAASAATEIPGLLSLKAYKALGTDHTYLAVTLWRDQESLEAWRNGPHEQRFIQHGKSHLLSSYAVSRFVSVSEPVEWRRD